MLSLIEDVSSFEELVAGTVHDLEMRELFAKYFNYSSHFAVPKAIKFAESRVPVLSEKTITRAVLLNTAAYIVEYISGEPFEKFLQSRYFHRFLQWKVVCRLRSVAIGSAFVDLIVFVGKIDA